jgi:microsomal epoxide hydrolase
LPGFEHRFSTVDGVRLHYVTGGKEDGEALVVLAGFPESRFAWRKVIPLLAPQFRIIAPDLPGQGDSDRPQEGYDTRALAVMVHGLLRQLGATRYCIMAAHDVGAWVAYPYAALFGDEIRRLVLMDAGIPGITLPDALPIAADRAWRTWHFPFHALPDLPEILIGGRERPYLDWFLRRKTAK